MCENPRRAAAAGVSSLINGSREAAGSNPPLQQDGSINTSSGLQTNNTNTKCPGGGGVTPIPPNVTGRRPAAAAIRKLNVWWLHLLAKWWNYNCHMMQK